MKVLCLILCLAAATPSVVRSQPSKDRTPFKPVDGAFFALSVADITASTQWYAEKLGLEVIMELPKQSGTAVTVLEGGGLVVELIQHDRARPLPIAAPGVTESLAASLPLPVSYAGITQLVPVKCAEPTGDIALDLLTTAGLALGEVRR